MISTKAIFFFFFYLLKELLKCKKIQGKMRLLPCFNFEKNSDKSVVEEVGVLEF
jgi:hypothetical protein